MKKVAVVAFAFIAAVALSSTSFAASGKALFSKHCAMCHSGGGNMMKPSDTLHAKDLKKNGIDTTSGIVAKIRKGGGGMPAFSKTAISDAQAKAIAGYIMKSFK